MIKNHPTVSGTLQSISVVLRPSSPTRRAPSGPPTIAPIVNNDPNHERRTYARMMHFIFTLVTVNHINVMSKINKTPPTIIHTNTHKGTTICITIQIYEGQSISKSLEP